MKLQIAFDTTDLNQSLEIAHAIADYTDIFEVGSLLIYKHGEHAVRTFKEKFPQKTILADAKIVDRGRETVQLFAQSGADIITVMAGTRKNIIHAATQQAEQMGKKIMLDLLDAGSLGQSALDAQNLGVTSLVYHEAQADQQHVTELEQWDMVKGNTALPVFISTNTLKIDDTKALDDIIKKGAAGLILGSIIIKADDPKEAARYFFEYLQK